MAISLNNHETRIVALENRIVKNFFFPDYSTWKSVGTTFTATEDGWFFGECQFPATSASIYVNGKQLAHCVGRVNFWEDNNAICIPLNKGDTVTRTSYTTGYFCSLNK